MSPANSNLVCLAAVRTDGGVCVVKLPTASSASFVLRFLETMCRHLQCDNLFSSQPFSHYAVYDRTKSGKNPPSICGKAPTGVTLTAISFLLSVWGNPKPGNQSCLPLLFILAVKEEALDTPSLIRGSKRSLSGVSPPYAAPLSPKHLRAEVHPSEGTAFG